MQLQVLDSPTATPSEFHSATSKSGTPIASPAHEAGLTDVASLTTEVGLTAEQAAASDLLKRSCASAAGLDRCMGLCILDHELPKRVSDQAEEKSGPHIIGNSQTFEEAGSSYS